MPALTFLRRRWYVGSDDFILLPLVMAGIKIFWVCVIGVLLAGWADGECKGALAQEVYLAGAGVLCALFGIEELFLARESRKGGVLTPSARRHIATILSFRCSLSIVTLAWTIYGSVVVATGTGNECEGITHIKKIQQIVFDGLIASEWVTTLAFFMLGYMAWDPNGRRTFKRGFAERYRDEYRQRWVKRIKKTCCCVSVQNEAFQEIADLFANMFRNTDLVPSDILVGLVLLRREQKALFNTEAEQPSIQFPQGGSAKIAGTRLVSNRHSTMSQSVNTDDIIACQSIYPNGPAEHGDTYSLFQELHGYMAVSLAAYGWPMYILDSGCIKGCFGLCKTRCFARKYLSSDATYCKCSSTVQHALSPGLEIVRTSTRNDDSFTPYSVLLDNTKGVLVVALRGTLSLEDIITDARAAERPVMNGEGNILGQAHKGICLVAENIIEDLRSSGVFEKYLSNRQYELVLTGHSLGAGTASLMAVMLREEYPTLKCYAFSPPGGLGDAALAHVCRDYVISVVFGKDIIPRLSEVTIQKARDDIMRCLSKHAYVCKHHVLGTCGCGEYIDSGEPPTWEGREAYESHYKRVLEDENETRLNMYPLGRVLHFLRDDDGEEVRKSKVLRRKKWDYTAVWRTFDELQELIVSHKMVNDHFPHENLKVLQAALAHTRPAPIPQSDKHCAYTQSTINTTATTSVLSKISLNTLFQEHTPDRSNRGPSSSISPLQGTSVTSPLLPAPSPLVHSTL